MQSLREAAKTVMRRAEDAPQPKAKRRSGDAAGGFRRLARKVSRRFDVLQAFRRRAAITSRYLTIPAEASAVASANPYSTLDMLTHWNNDAENSIGITEHFDTDNNHISPCP